MSGVLWDSHYSHMILNVHLQMCFHEGTNRSDQRIRVFIQDKFPDKFISILTELYVMIVKVYL